MLEKEERARARLVMSMRSRKMEDEVDLRLKCDKAFQNAAKIGQNYLTPEDYKVAVLELLGYKPSKYEISSVWSAHSQGKAGLEREQFVTLMLERLLQKDQDELLREMFVTLDITGRGFVTEQDCRAAFGHIVPHMQSEVIRNMFEELDVDRDGRVSYKDFEIMMKSTIMTGKHTQNMHTK